MELSIPGVDILKKDLTEVVNTEGQKLFLPENSLSISVKYKDRKIFPNKARIGWAQDLKLA